MKVVAFVYVVLEIFSGCFLWREVGGEIGRHVWLTLPAIGIYMWTCYRKVVIDIIQPGYANFDDMELT